MPSKATIELVDEDLSDRVTWFKMSNSHRVVCLKEDVYAYDYPQVGTHPLAHVYRPVPTPAKLTLTTRIADYGFFLYPCGLWSPENVNIERWEKGLEKARARAWVEDPQLPDDEPYFTDAMRNLHGLLAAIPEARTGFQGLINQHQPLGRLRIGHRVFKKPDATHHPYQDLPEFQIENIPLAYESARPYLSQIADRWDFSPIPAFYRGSKSPLHPSQYENLRGKLVRLQFSLNFWYIDGRPVFAADILDIRLFERDPAIVAAPKMKRKRRAVARSSNDQEEDVKPTLLASPTKKRRTA